METLRHRRRGILLRMIQRVLQEITGTFPSSGILEAESKGRTKNCHFFSFLQRYIGLPKDMNSDKILKIKERKKGK